MKVTALARLVSAAVWLCGSAAASNNTTGQEDVAGIKPQSAPGSAANRLPSLRGSQPQVADTWNVEDGLPADKGEAARFDGSETQSLIAQSQGCRTATEGETCWDEIQWAKDIGSNQHADWYPGLDGSSSTQSFQCVVHQSNPDKCPAPCGFECAPKAAQTAPQPSPPTSGSVRILHISDTHSMHRTIKNSQLPPADVLIHTGDVTENGRDDQYGDFNDWLGRIKGSYKFIFIIPGNHDWWEANSRHSPDAVADPAAFVQQRVTNAKVLHHETAEVMGIRIWGAGWHPMSSDTVSGNNYGDVPAGIDVLVTHDPPLGIFDSTFVGNWGSSSSLLGAVQRAKPKVHLFGHVHEQQGEWHKVDGKFEGGVTYRPAHNPSGMVFKANPPPSPDFPPELIINGAMADQATVDHAFTGRWDPMRITGPSHLISAEIRGGAWHFSIQSTQKF
eukprot:TRINITY_DN1498_c0_g1_i5.p1 TRINITY_DN1498_c0_g1~~TRINITY_DN1498_c0_g1_i5.p1  ORF type:complete len:446 (-),score=77.87 TRINITY_DN1498_c0_g1_i5:147-1484(-)